ncbi:unnamed protein product [Closterium sp. NIES-65]|nr:unnamed protein product [Closterium sp. NIES-65]
MLGPGYGAGVASSPGASVSILPPTPALALPLVMALSSLSSSSCEASTSPCSFSGLNSLPLSLLSALPSSSFATSCSFSGRSWHSRYVPDLSSAGSPPTTGPLPPLPPRLPPWSPRVPPLPALLLPPRPLWIAPVRLGGIYGALPTIARLPFGGPQAILPPLARLRVSLPSVCSWASSAAAVAGPDCARLALSLRGAGWVRIFLPCLPQPARSAWWFSRAGVSLSSWAYSCVPASAPAAVVSAHSPLALLPSTSSASSAFVPTTVPSITATFTPTSLLAVSAASVVASSNSAVVCSSAGFSAAFLSDAAHVTCPCGCFDGFPCCPSFPPGWGECPPIERLLLVEQRVATVGTVLELLAGVLDQLHASLRRGRVACPPLLKKERAAAVAAARQMMLSFPRMGLVTGSPGVGSGPGPSAVRRLASSARCTPLDVVPAAAALLRWLDGRLALILAE